VHKVFIFILFFLLLPRDFRQLNPYPAAVSLIPCTCSFLRQISHAGLSSSYATNQHWLWTV